MDQIKQNYSIYSYKNLSVMLSEKASFKWTNFISLEFKNPILDIVYIVTMTKA